MLLNNYAQSKQTKQHVSVNNALQQHKEIFHNNNNYVDLLNFNTSAETANSASAALSLASPTKVTDLLKKHHSLLLTTARATYSTNTEATITSNNVYSNQFINYHNGSYIGGATDFSIAAIMARGGNASSREPSERSLSE